MITVMDTLLAWYPVVTVLIFLIPMCYYDWTIREVPDKLFGALILINLPVFIYEYATGIFGVQNLLWSIPFCIMYYLVMLRWPHYFHGDDMILLCIISMFCVVNPRELGGITLAPMPVTVMLYFVGTMCVTLGLNFWRNLALGKRMDWFNMMNDFEGGLPLVLPIAAAFVLALVI